MFVRRRTSGNQLIESYRDADGKPRQRVVCSLGRHETPEDALGAAVEELLGVLEEPQRAEARSVRFEERMKDQYDWQLEKWHGGEVPPLEEVIERAREGIRPEWERYERPDERHDPAKSSEYARDFMGAYEEDLAEFVYDVRELEELRAKAVVARKAVAEKEQKLRARIETLRGVVSK